MSRGKRKQPSKTECQKVHFQRRADQRLGGLDADLRKWIVSCIQANLQSGPVKFYDRQSGRLTRWLVTIDCAYYLVVYDKERKTLVTIFERPDLAPNYLSSAERAEDLRSTAFQKAGQAVVGAWLGLRVQSFTIAPGGEGRGLAGFERAEGYDNKIPFDALSAQARKRLEANIIASFSGPKPECHLQGRSRWLPGHETVFAQAVELVDRILPKKSSKAYVRWLCERSLDYVSHPQIWPVISELAERLLSDTILPGSVVRKLVRAARDPSLRPQLDQIREKGGRGADVGQPSRLTTQRPR